MPGIGRSAGPRLFYELDADVELLQEVRQAGVASRGVGGGIGGHAFVDVGAPRGEDPDATLDVGVGGVVLVEGDALRGGGHVGIELFGAAGEVDVDVGDVALRAGVVLQVQLDARQDAGARLVQVVVFLFAVALDVERHDGAVDFEEEADDGLVKAGIDQGFPLEEAAELPCVCGAEVEVAQGVAAKMTV